jgi:uncharacterized protein with NRDE domain
MCTLALAFRVDRRWPLVVAANRDERLGRPAEGWAVRAPERGPRHAAPRDLLAGGTWIGVSARGVFAAITNYHAPGGFPDLSRRSRGELVPLALSAPDAAAAREALGAVDAALYNPFHLAVADAERAFLWRFDGERAALDDLRPGLHVVTESSPDGRCPRGDLVRARWPLQADAAHLREVLSVHAEGREATCIHRDPRYGTRSSAILRLALALEASELFAADGPPCTAPLEDRSALLQALARGRPQSQA